MKPYLVPVRIFPGSRSLVVKGGLIQFYDPSKERNEGQAEWAEACAISNQVPFNVPPQSLSHLFPLSQFPQQPFYVRVSLPLGRAIAIPFLLFLLSHSLDYITHPRLDLKSLPYYLSKYKCPGLRGPWKISYQTTLLPLALISLLGELHATHTLQHLLVCRSATCSSALWSLVSPTFIIPCSNYASPLRAVHGSELDSSVPLSSTMYVIVLLSSSMPVRFPLPVKYVTMLYPPTNTHSIFYAIGTQWKWIE